MMTKMVEMMYAKNEVYDITVLLAATAILERALGEVSLTLSQTTNFRLFQTERVCRRQLQI